MVKITISLMFILELQCIWISSFLFFYCNVLNIVSIFSVWGMISPIICYILSVIYVLEIYFLQVIQLILDAEMEM